jgi:uncharacterized protein YbjT (DUF2867 family)
MPQFESGLIAVTGATGRIGGAVARHLLAEGWQVRALTRKPSGKPAQRLAALGAEIRGADMRHKTELASAFAGAAGVFSIQNPMLCGYQGEIQQGINVAEAAAINEIRHLVYGSAGVGEGPTGILQWDSKLVVEAKMRNLGLGVTVLRPMALMELMTDRSFFPWVSTWGVLPKLVGPDRSIPWICADDVGAVATKAFADPVSFTGREIALAADIRSMNECRELWRVVTGRAPRSVALPVPVFERMAGRSGKDLTRMWHWLSTADLDLTPAETRSLLPAALTVETWLAQVMARSIYARGSA